MALPTPRDSRWIATRSGGQFWQLDPRKEDFDSLSIDDIAHSLANTGRYRGMSSRFYSVAEHSVLMSEVAPPGLKKEALMHDSPEGPSPFGDVSGPVKDAFPMVKAMEDILGAGLARRFCFTYPPGPEVKLLDRRICLDERRALFGDNRPWPGNKAGDAFLDVKIMGYPPHAAARRFLEQWELVQGEQGLADQLRVSKVAA